ncbi:hypothetical protein DOE76_13845 [Leifsonia sp. ku-ls]|nr:hypothetical protein DOE76_13845 [Leifsonia sp. ku-ls]
MGRRLRTVTTLVVLALAVAALVIVGMADPNWSGRSAARCLPARLTASPGTVAPGESLTVSSTGADCDLGYRAGHTYTVALHHPGQSTPPIETAVAEDGSFRLTLTVPATFPSGPAAVIVHGSPMDDCHDTGSSCAGYAASVTVR